MFKYRLFFHRLAASGAFLTLARQFVHEQEELRLWRLNDATILDRIIWA